jgi:hypothetical protein
VREPGAGGEGRAGAAHSFTRYPDTATAFASKWNVAPGCNIILNGVPKEKVSDTVASVLVATKLWKALPLSPSWGSVITIDTLIWVFAEVGRIAKPETCSIIRRNPAGTVHGLAWKGGNASHTVSHPGCWRR